MVSPQPLRPVSQTWWGWRSTLPGNHYPKYTMQTDSLGKQLGFPSLFKNTGEKGFHLLQPAFTGEGWEAGNRHHGSQGASPARGTLALRALEIRSQHSQKRLKPLGSFHRKEQTHLSHHSFRTRCLEPARIPRKAGKLAAHASFSKASSYGGSFIPTRESQATSAEIRGYQFALKIAAKFHRGLAASTWSFGMGEKFLPATPPASGMGLEPSLTLNTLVSVSHSAFTLSWGCGEGGNEKQECCNSAGATRSFSSWMINPNCATSFCFTIPGLRKLQLSSNKNTWYSMVLKSCMK